MDTGNKDMDPITEMLLYAASRAQHVSQVIRPALEKGKIVLCDRFVDSSIAYQGFGRGLGIEMVEEANRIALQGILPDLTLFFDLDPEEGLKRSSWRDREADRLEMESLNFHKRVYKGFKALFLKYPERYKRVRAELEIDEIKSQIFNIISE
ncbi:MAG TPA: dTMP kinase, partial [Clostridia bacterium]|nr:dTMP kinase [Clostridia bacterium]